MNINQIQNNAMMNSQINSMQINNKNNDVSMEKNQSDFKFSMEKQNVVELNQAEQVEMMIENIDEVKSKIESDLTVDNVLKYKELVTSFLKYYTENVLTLETQNSQHGKYGYKEKLTTVQKVEDGVRDIEDMMGLLETKSGHLEMLKRIGEINGLVMNLKL